MKEQIFKMGLILGILAVFFVFGCSDDDSGTPPDEGDLTDPAFLFADNMLGTEMNNLNFMSIEGIMGNIVDTIIENEAAGKIAWKVQKPSFNTVLVTSSYVQDGSWYRFTDSMAVFGVYSDEPDSVLYSGVDSLGFYYGGALVVPSNPEQLDSIVYKNYGTFYVYDDGVELVVAYTASFTLTGQFGTDYFTIDATVDYDITGTVDFGDGNTCEGTMDVSIIYTDMDFDWTDDLMPVEGNASATASIAFTCAEGVTPPDVQGTWTATWALGGGSVTSTYVHGEDRWVYTESME